MNSFFNLLFRFSQFCQRTVKTKVYLRIRQKLIPSSSLFPLIYISTSSDEILEDNKDVLLTIFSCTWFSLQFFEVRAIRPILAEGSCDSEGLEELLTVSGAFLIISTVLYITNTASVDFSSLFLGGVSLMCLSRMRMSIGRVMPWLSEGSWKMLQGGTVNHHWMNQKYSEQAWQSGAQSRMASHC